MSTEATKQNQVVTVDGSLERTQEDEKNLKDKEINFRRECFLDLATKNALKHINKQNLNNVNASLKSG